MSEGKFGQMMEVNSEDRRFYLFQESIYAFHRILYEILEDDRLGQEIKNKKILIVPSLFSKHSRTFHWLVARWTGVFNNEIFTGFRETQKSNSNDWQGFLDNLHASLVLHHIKEATNCLISIPQGADARTEEVRKLLGYYEGFHHDPRLYLDGIVFRNLEILHQSAKGRSAKIDYISGQLAGEKNVHYETYQWLEAHFFQGEEEFGAAQGMKKWQCQELPKASDVLERLPVDHKKIPGLGVAEQLNSKLFFGLLEGRRRNHVIVIPLYDTRIGNDAWGSLCGNIALIFTSDEDLKCFIGTSNGESLLKRFTERALRISQEFTRSGTFLALAQPIEPPYDLLSHFLKNLTIFQDWDSVTVFQGDKPQYCYHWQTDESVPVDEPEWRRKKWGRCKCKEGDCNCGTRGSANDKELLRWEHDYGNEWFLPDITDEESKIFQGIRLTFKYPITACIPEDDIKRKMLEEEYIRQQLEVLRGLIPKVRARRAALRSAVSAIMGRNMSHNIGSHVLARYSSKIREDFEKTSRDKADHRGEFLAYLQRRMDFLAEVATSDQAFWSQPLSLKEQIIRLNYGEQQKRFIGLTEQQEGYKSGGEPCLYHLSPKSPKELKNRPIILSFITGKESLLASVEWGAPKADCQNPPDQDPTDCCRGYLPNREQEDVWFACPGGEVGVQALYIILENIIRNSARHGGTSDGTVRIFVHVESDQPDSDLLQVEIIDPRTELKPVQYREKIKGGMTDGAKKEEATEEVKELETRHADSLFEDGKRKKLICLDREINSILHDEPFLDASGNPNPKYWGVREMQICAHYLRGNRLSDLEGMRDNKPVLEAGVHKLKNGSHCLKYTLYLQRAKLMAAVVKEDSAYKDRASALRQKGIFVVGSENAKELDWKKIAADVSGYSFLVVGEGIDLPKEMRASLPVRTFNLSLKKIKTALDDLSHEIAWMEPLHQHWAEKCRNRRGAWMGKPLWGVAVEKDDALKVPNRNASSASAPPGSQNNGLFWVQKASIGSILPLPNSVAEWHKSLENKAIAAAWVDHPSCDQVDLGGAGLGQVYQVINEDVRYWISVEGAFSDSPHTAYLNSCPEGSGWEILAAAVPRVAVLDERVQSELNTPSRIGFELSKAWACMGVWVPEKPKMNGIGSEAGNGNRIPACDLDAPAFDQIQAFLKHPAERDDQFPIDFLVMHLTILERLSNEKNISLRQTLTKLMSGTQAEHAEIIIVTGRGVPSIALDPDNMDNARYLPISALLESLVVRPSKLALMRVIWSASRPGQESNQ